MLETCKNEEIHWYSLTIAIRAPSSVPKTKTSRSNCRPSWKRLQSKRSSRLVFNVTVIWQRLVYTLPSAGLLRLRLGASRYGLAGTGVAPSRVYKKWICNKRASFCSIRKSVASMNASVCSHLSEERLITKVAIFFVCGRGTLVYMKIKRRPRRSSSCCPGRQIRSLYSHPLVHRRAIVRLPRPIPPRLQHRHR